MSNNQKVTCFIVVTLLVASNIYFAVKYFFAQRQLRQTENYLEVIQFNKKYLDFNKLFIAKILKAEGTVDIESRLELENAVRNLNDAEILSQWKKFINSPDGEEAQKAIKNLLGLLAERSAF